MRLLIRMTPVSTRAKSLDAPRTGKGKKSQDPVDIFVFLIPCVQFIHINLVGVLSGSDLMLLAAFLYLAFRKKLRLATPTSKVFVIFGSLWLVSQCVTDMVRHTAFADLARGWSMIGLTLSGFVVLCTLMYGQPRRLVLYGWGLVAGNVLAFFISPSDYALGYPWKFGLAYPVTLAVLLFASRQKCRDPWKIALCVAIGILNMGLGSRGTGGVCLAVALYLLFTRIMQRKAAANTRVRVALKVALAASIVLGAAGIMWAYQYAATTGLLGEEARQKYVSESSGQYGILLGGRGDVLGAFAAIYDSPILGHGSWAKDWSYILAQQETMALLGYRDAGEISQEEVEGGVIPAHSHLLQAWVWAGIVGALFWAWVFVLTARMLMRIYPPAVVLLPVMSFMALSLLWDILFSPFGATERIIFPYDIVLLLTCAEMVPRKVVRTSPSKIERNAKGRINAVLTPRPQL